MSHSSEKFLKRYEIDNILICAMCYVCHPSHQLKRSEKLKLLAGGLLVLEGIILPVVSTSALTWFIRYIFMIFTVPK